MGAEYKVHTKLLTEFETLGVMGENCSGIIIVNIHQISAIDFSSAFVFDIHTFMHTYESVKAAIFCQPMYLWAVIFVISQILRV